MIRQFLLLFKPWIILGNILAMSCGYVLGTNSEFRYLHLLGIIFSLSLIIASACVLNNIYDRVADSKMSRTRHRAIASGRMTPHSALMIAIFCGALGIGWMSQLASVLTLVLAIVAFFVYVFLYTPLKYRTPWATYVGAIAGALPPVIGYTAVQPNLDLVALTLFGLVFFWQIPHFHAISLRRLSDYSAVPIPVLPIQGGIEMTRQHMLISLLAYLATTPILFLTGHTGWFYLVLALGSGGAWVGLTIYYMYSNASSTHFRKSYILSLIAMSGLCLGIWLDHRI